MLLGVVILYNPEEDVKGHILSYLPFLDKLIIWDNTPGGEQMFDLSFGEYDSKILFWSEYENKGVAYALNKAAIYGMEFRFSHLLTMDQDSYFDRNVFEFYLNRVNEVDTDKIAAFCVNRNREMLHSSIEEVYNCITSGTFYSLKAIKKMGLFRDDFFIDAIDGEYSYRIKRAGYMIIQLNDVFMHHTLGNQTIHDICGRKIIALNYSPIRTYYIIRNHIIVYKQYGFQKSRLFWKTFLYYRFLSILFVETNKTGKLKAMIMGICHGVLGRTGEFNI